MKAKTAVVALAASLAAWDVVAQDEESAPAPAEEATASAEATPASGAGAQAQAMQPAKAEATFTTLPFCRIVEPPVEVKKPGGEWTAAEEGRFYPLGTSYRTHKDGRLVLSFGMKSTATISGEASFSTRMQPIGSPSRTLVLAYGDVVLNLAENTPEGAFFVAAPGFMVRNLAGESRYSYETTPNGDRARVRCVTGSLGLSGRHFDIAAMHAANEVVITSEHDFLVTMLEGTSGDYVVKLDQGVRAGTEVDDSGAMKEVVTKDSLDWHLSPRTKVVINRAVPAIGERMAVHTMAFDAVGELQSDRIFCEGRAEINSGELVVKKSDGEDLAKRAAEAAETTEEVPAEDAPAENAPADGGTAGQTPAPADGDE